MSNDKALRAGCEAESVSILWGFDVLALLVDERALEPAAAIEVVRANRRVQPQDRSCGDGALQGAGQSEAAPTIGAPALRRPEPRAPKSLNVGRSLRSVRTALRDEGKVRSVRC